MRSPARLCRLDETVKKKTSGDLVRGLSKAPDSSPVGSSGKGGKCVFVFFLIFFRNMDSFRPKKSLIVLFIYLELMR